MGADGGRGSRGLLRLPPWKMTKTDFPETITCETAYCASDREQYVNERLITRTPHVAQPLSLRVFLAPNTSSPLPKRLFLLHLRFAAKYPRQAWGKGKPHMLVSRTRVCTDHLSGNEMERRPFWTRSLNAKPEYRRNGSLFHHKPGALDAAKPTKATWDNSASVHNFYVLVIFR